MKINKNLNFSLLYNIANALFPLATLPIVFRAMSPTTYGNIVFSNLIYQLLIALFFSSLISFSIREYKENKEKSIKDIYTLQIFFTVISVLLYFFFSLFLKCFFNETNEYLYIFLICTCFSFLHSDWVLFAEQDYKKLLLRTLCVKGILLLFIYFFINNEEDDYLYASLLAIGYTANNIIAYYYVRRFYGIRINFLISNIKSSIFNARYFISSATVGISYQYVDQLIVGVLLNSSSLAYINVLKQILGMLSIVPNTVCRFYLPKATIAYSNTENIKEYHNSLYLKFLLMILFFATNFILFGQHSLNLFLGDKFNITDISIYICALIFFVSATSVYLDTQHSIPLHYEKVTFVANVIVAIFYLSSLYWVAIVYGYNGVLLSLAVAEFLGVIYVCLFYLRRKELWLK
ncbi:oligosaccharide flippase family protein [Shewanella baltica]|uniref:oligosaccharide flippase family protein n=1 Tax=Shewanella baltica TaxID=62322 RepID=UPI00217D38DE|nr:oligosaccharide flippase family protein [Shewanella baltica]MCS6229729.1 oligosaccharide flippase family protein [Shewanella baltica]